MENKRGSIIVLKIVGAGLGSVGFIVWALSTTQVGALMGTGLIGIGSVLIVGGS